jgi:hypothetical protein
VTGASVNPLPAAGATGLTDAQLRATAVPVSGSGVFHVDDNAGSLTVDSTQLPAALAANGGIKVEGVAGGVAQPVSGPLTDTQLRASAVPVSGTVTANQGTAAAVAGAWTAKVTDGTNTAAVKAASTAAAAADPSLVVALHPTSPLPTGANTIGALTANQSVNLAQVAGTAASTGSRITDAGVQSVFQAAPTAANILVGHVAQTATTAAATVITVPINRTWVGTITLVCDVAEAAAGTVAGQALGTVTTTGASAVPAAGTVFSAEARCAANVAAGLSGTQGNVSASIPMVVSAGASALATIALASTQAGTNSRVACTASGYLV